MARQLVDSILSHNLKVYSRRGLNLWGDWILLPSCLYRGMLLLQVKTPYIIVLFMQCMYVYQCRKELTMTENSFCPRTKTTMLFSNLVLVLTLHTVLYCKRFLLGATALELCRKQRQNVKNLFNSYPSMKCTFSDLLKVQSS